MFEDNWSCHLLLLITPLGKYFDNTIARPIKKHKKLQLWHLPVTAINDGITANLVIWVSKYLQCLLKTLCKKKAYSNTEVTNVERKKKNTLKLYWCIKICYWEDFLMFPILVRHFFIKHWVQSKRCEWGKAQLETSLCLICPVLWSQDKISLNLVVNYIGTLLTSPVQDLA